MRDQNSENPSMRAGVFKEVKQCVCRCDLQFNDATKIASRQVKLSPTTRHDLADLRDYLLQKGGDNLTVLSSIGAVDFLLRNF